MKKRNDKAAYIPKWIPIKEAARLMNRNYGHVRKLAKVWARDGMAELRKLKGAKPIYFVRSDAHPDLAGRGQIARPWKGCATIAQKPERLELEEEAMRGEIMDRMRGMNLRELVQLFLLCRKVKAR